MDAKLNLNIAKKQKESRAKGVTSRNYTCSGKTKVERTMAQ